MFYSAGRFVRQSHNIFKSHLSNSAAPFYQSTNTSFNRINSRSFHASRPSCKKDYYKVLGVTKHSTKDEIKRNFRELAKKYHPDLNKEPNAITKFKEVSEAYEVLEDDHKRKLYDSYGVDGVDGSHEIYEEVQCAACHHCTVC